MARLTSVSPTAIAALPAVPLELGDLLNDLERGDKSRIARFVDPPPAPPKRVNPFPSWSFMGSTTNDASWDQLMREEQWRAMVREFERRMREVADESHLVRHVP